MPDQNYNVLVNYSVNDELSPQMEVMADQLATVDEEIEDQTKSVAKAETSWKSLAKAVGIAGLAYKGLSIGKKSIEDFKEQDKANRLTTISFGENAQAVQDYASELQELTGIGDETSLMYLSMLKNMGRTTEESKAMLRASADLVAGSGGMIPMEMALKNLASSFGGTAGRLGEFIPEIKLLTKEQLKTGAAVELVTRKYGGLSEQIMATDSGEITRLTNSIGDVSEEIGAQLIPAQIEWLKMQKSLMVVVADLSPVLTGITKSISIFANTIEAVASNRIATGLSATALAIVGINSAVKGGIPSWLSFNRAVKANPIGVWTTAAVVAVGAVSNLTDTITGAMNKASEASGGFAGGSSAMLAKAGEQLQRFQELSAKGNFATKAEIKERKSLSKALKDSTGHMVLYDIATGKATLRNKWQTLSVEDLTKSVEIQEGVEERVAKQTEANNKALEEAERKRLLAAEKKAKAEEEAAQRAREKENREKNALSFAQKISDEYLLIGITGSEREIAVLEMKYQKELALLSEFYGAESEQIKQLQALRADGLKSIEDKEQAEKMERLKTNMDEAQAVRDAKEAERVAKEKEAEEARRANLATTIDFATQGANMLSEIWSGVTAKKQKNLEKETKAQIEAINKSTKSEAQKAKAIGAIEKDAQGERHKLALSDWKDALLMSVVNTGLGITKTMATMGYPAGIPFSIALAATGAVNTGLIASNKPEKMSEGGVQSGGSTVSDSNLAYVNPGERVINKGRTRKLDKLIDAGSLGGSNQYTVEMPITVQGNATQGVVDQLKEVTNETVDMVLRALEMASEQNKIDPSRFAFA